MTATPTVTCAVAAGCTLGEGVLWDEEEGAVYWVDIKDPAVYRFDPTSGEHRRWAMPERVGFLARRRDAGEFVAGFKSGLVTLALEGGTARVEPLAGYAPGGPDDRINDGFVDARGRLWFGTMDDREREATGYLHVYDSKHPPQRRDGPYIVTNGPCASPDGRVLYHTDTVGRTIWAFDLHDDATLTGRRMFVRFEDDSWGSPDGMACDAEGYVWICHWGGGRITRFTPDGLVDRVLPLPTPQITKCAFGGDDFRTLWVTSAAVGLESRGDDLPGGLFRIDLDVTGLPANRFAG